MIAGRYQFTKVVFNYTVTPQDGAPQLVPGSYRVGEMSPTFTFSLPPLQIDNLWSISPAEIPNGVFDVIAVSTSTDTTDPKPERTSYMQILQQLMAIVAAAEAAGIDPAKIAKALEVAWNDYKAGDNILQMVQDELAIFGYQPAPTPTPAP